MSEEDAMCSCKRCGAGFWIGLILVGLVVAWGRMDQDQRKFVRNLLAQAADLPARYAT
jgi:hypothetical protein